ncbi:inorganic pyrophosphatase, partial [Mycoplasmopsis pullorum]
MKNLVQIKIEIPKNSKIKYEYNRKTQEIEVDRILR